MIGLRSGDDASGSESVLVRRLPLADQDSLTSADTRVLTILNDSGRRLRWPWRDVVQLRDLVERNELPSPGPRTTAWGGKSTNQRQVGAMDWHRLWRSVPLLENADWGVELHEVATRMLARAGEFDGIEVCNLACMENLLRQLQLIEYAYRQESDIGSKYVAKGKGRPGLFGQPSIFAGTHRENGDAMIALDLLDYVSEEVERYAIILKQERKAREEPEPIRGKGNNKSDNKNGE